MTKCRHCGANVPQTSKRERFYCNDKCRKAYKRSNSGQPIADKSITDTPIADTHIEGTCYGCGEKQPNLLCDICHKCIAKGCTRESLGLEITERQRWLNECQA